MDTEKKYFAKGKLNGDDADFTIEPNDYVNLVNCRRGTTDFSAGAIGYVESIGSTILATVSKFPLIQVHIQRTFYTAMAPSYAYVGWYIFFNGAYYAIAATEAMNTPNFNYPPLPPPPTSVVLADLVNRGATQDDVIASIQPGAGPVYTSREFLVMPINVAITDYTFLPAGQNYTIGNTYDEVGNRILYFNWNSNGNHGIYSYDIDGKITYAVLLNSSITGGLNFNYRKQIHSCRVIDGLLFWTDNLNEPRRINIDAAIKASNPSYITDVSPYSLPVSQEVITIIRKPPVYPLSGTKINDPDISTNLVKNNAFRFAGFYYYRDGEKSTLSVQSLLDPYNTKTETFNAIELKLPFAEKIDQDVQSYTIAVIYAVGETGFEIKTWDKDNADDLAEINAHNAGTTQLTYIFASNSVGPALDAAYKVKPFDSVPLLSGTLERANNRLFLANNIEGYDSPPITSLSGRVITVDNTSDTFAAQWWRIGQNYFYTSGPTVSTTFYIPYSPVFTDSLHPVGYYFHVGNIPQNTPPTGITNINFTDYFFIGATVADVQTFLTQEFPPVGTPSATTYSPFQVDNAYPLTITAGTTIVTNQILKSDSTYQLGVVFYDADLRQCGVVTRKRAIVTTPDRSYDLSTTYNYGIEWRLNANLFFDEIPVWAKYYGIVSTKSLRTNFFMQARAKDIKYATKDPDGTYTFTATTYTTDKVGVAFNLDYLNGYGLGYIFVEGDVIKVYIQGSSDVISLSILGVQANYVYAELHDFGDVSAKNAFFEIYTPQPQQASEFYYEQAQIYPLNNPGPSATYSQLSGTLPGDVYLLQRIQPPDSYITENMSPNDTFWKNWLTNAGRVQIKDSIGQQVKKTGISYSDVFIPGTRTNGLSTFDALNERILPVEIGTIRKLQLTSKIDALGNVMLAIAEKQTASIYIGEVQLYGSNAPSALVQADTVIGTVNPLRGSYGTVNPESVVEFRGNVYWLDAQSGKYIQYAANGLFPISNFKTTKFWKLFSETYLSLTQDQIEALGSLPFVYTGIDPHNEELLVSVPRVLQNPPKGYLPDYPTTVYPFDIWDGRQKSMVYKFLEGDTSWQGSYNQLTAENFCYAVDDLYSFKNGILWLHNSETSFGNFYGVQNSPFIAFACNAMPNQPKVYENNEIESNLVPSLTYFYAQNKNFNQASDLMFYEYQEKEGIYSAGIMNDKLTPGIATGLLNGSKMRTTALYVMLTFDVSNGPLQFKFYNISYNRSWGHSRI